jgi:hypothetical protein
MITIEGDGREGMEGYDQGNTRIVLGPIYLEQSVSERLFASHSLQYETKQQKD